MPENVKGKQSPFVDPSSPHESEWRPASLTLTWGQGGRGTFDTLNCVQSKTAFKLPIVSDHELKTHKKKSVLSQIGKL